MKVGKIGNDRFIGYSRDRFEVLRVQKEELFHRKYGRFANKSASMANSRESTMIEPGTMFSMDSLFEDSVEKLFALASIGRICLIIS